MNRGRSTKNIDQRNKNALSEKKFDLEDQN